MITVQSIDWQEKMPGRYRLKRLIGKGGMGEVWQAEDTELDRQIAIKLLPPVLRHEEDYLRSFVEEARMAAALEHPHILPVHDFGEFQVGDDVITYLITPLISGGSLHDLIKKNKGALSVTTALSYLKQAAEAIDYAHSKKILHRDIKPANMLLQDDWLLLSDFGLARLLTTHTYRSRTHAGAGTPGYMAPEQIRGKAVQASDLYSLAMVAYQLLTGRLPFHGDSPFGVFLQHINEAPPPPRQYNPLLPETMEQTILKGLAKIPTERHSSCLAFVNELEQGWRADGHPEPPRIDPEITLIAPWNRRALANIPTQQSDEATLQPPSSLSELSSQMNTPTTVEEATNTELSEKTVLTGIEGEQKDEAEQQLTAERRAKNSIGRRTFLAGGAAAVLLLAGGGTALNALYQSRQDTGPKKLIAGIPLLKLTGHTRSVDNVRWNPQGRYVASYGNDANMLIWDIDKLISSSTQQTRIVSQPSALWKPDAASSNNDQIDWSPDGRRLVIITNTAVGQEDAGAMAIVDTFTPDARATQYTNKGFMTQTGNFVCLAWSSKKNLIASSYFASNGNVYAALWQPDQPANIPTLLSDTVTTTPGGSAFYMSSLCWSIDGTWLIGIDITLKVHCWNVAASRAQAQSITLPDRTKYHPEQLPGAARFYNLSVVASPTEATLFAATNSDVAVVYDIQQKKVLHLLGSDDPTANKTIQGPGTSQYYPQVNSLAWSPNGRYLVGSYLSSPLIFVWDLQNPQPRMKNGAHMPDLTFGQKNGHSDTVLDLSWSPDGRYLASSSSDSTVIVWKMDAE